MKLTDITNGTAWGGDGEGKSQPKLPLALNNFTEQNTIWSTVLTERTFLIEHVPHKQQLPPVFESN